METPRPRRLRAKLGENVLRNWYLARQDKAMIAQFGGDESVTQSEQRDWRRMCRAAASRKLKRPAR